jgi:hypothetical protein
VAVDEGRDKLARKVPSAKLVEPPVLLNVVVQVAAIAKLQYEI